MNGMRKKGERKSGVERRVKKKLINIDGGDGKMKLIKSKMVKIGLKSRISLVGGRG